MFRVTVGDEYANVYFRPTKMNGTSTVGIMVSYEHIPGKPGMYLLDSQKEPPCLYVDGNWELRQAGKLKSLISHTCPKDPEPQWWFQNKPCNVCDDTPPEGMLALMGMDRLG